MLRNLTWCQLLLVVLGLSCGSGVSSARRISGAVTGATSGGVTVTLACVDPVVNRTAVTDEQGRFAFESVPDAACTVTPALRGYRFNPAVAEVAPGPKGLTTVGFAAQLLLQVRGADITGDTANVDVQHAGQVVEDAVVLMDGQVVPFLPAAGHYSGPLPFIVSAGGQVTLEVSAGGASVTGIGLVPEVPALTAPASGEYFSSSDDIVVSWTSTTSPDSFAVSARWSCGPGCGTGVAREAPGSARSLTIPAGSLPSGEIQLSVIAYNDGELWGDYEPADSHPGMNVRSESGSVALTEGVAPGRSVSGVVSGAATSGVTLGLSCWGAADRTTVTDDQGEYAFVADPGVDCVLTPELSGYAFVPASVALNAGSGDQTGVDFAARLLLQVRGAAIGNGAGCVEVRHAGQVVDAAVVRINGVDIPFMPGSERYCASSYPMVTPGEGVALEVASDGATVTGFGLMPDAPVMTAPAANAQLTPGEDVEVSWTSATSPDSFVVTVGWSCGPSCGAGRSFQAPGSARTLVLPADMVPTGALSLSVYAYNDGVLAGDYEPFAADLGIGPGMNIRSDGSMVLVSR